MRRLWPLTARGTGAVALAVACFVIANEVGIVELMYFGILLVAVTFVVVNLVTDIVLDLLNPRLRHGAA